jgi:hypothetical protein
MYNLLVSMASVLDGITHSMKRKLFLTTLHSEKSQLSYIGNISSQLLRGYGAASRKTDRLDNAWPTNVRTAINSYSQVQLYTTLQDT